MNCPYCGFKSTCVLDSRSTEEKTRRRRECLGCGKRFTTYEAVERPQILVRKKSGAVEPFNSVKLINGIYNAIKKRPVSSTRIMALVEEIEDDYARQMRTMVTSSEIGNDVMRRLRKIDPVAYIRFASVYQNFTDVAEFVAAVNAPDEEENNTAQNPRATLPKENGGTQR